MGNTLTYIITESALKFPNKVAFRCNNESLTYQQIYKKSTQIASFLKSIGIKKGDRVGILLNRSLETAVSIYGILLAHAVYVPLDTESQSLRNKFVIKDCGIEVILTNPSQKRRLEKILEHSIDLRMIIGLTLEGVKSITWDKLYQNESFKNNLVHPDTDDLAYILYTSGSTGTPKGIMHSHASGFSYARLSVDFYGILHSDTLANHSAINFDISTFGYFAGPLAGATTVIVSDPHIKMPASLANFISKEKISIWYSVPFALIQLLEQEAIREINYSNLRWVLFAGEPFPTPKLRMLMKTWPQARFSNIFGPTEVNGCTYHVVDEIPTDNQAISIGKPWKETEIIIIDSHGNDLQNGSPGELLVSTTTMMKGYWGDKTKTSKSFYKREGKTFYRTGDLVRMEASGNLTFLGRKDRQVKVKGYRIELDEVDAVLWKCEQLVEATTVLDKNEKNENIIVALVVLKEGIQINQVKKFCREYLSSYAMPQRFDLIDKIPRNSRGKIDHGKLRKMISIE